MKKLAVLLFVLVILLIACTTPAPAPTTTPQPTREPAATVQPTVGEVQVFTEDPCGALKAEVCDRVNTFGQEVSVVDSHYNGRVVRFKQWVLAPGALTGIATMDVIGAEVTIENVFIVVSDFGTPNELIVGTGEFAEDGTITMTGDVQGELEILSDGGPGLIVNLKTRP